MVTKTSQMLLLTSLAKARGKKEVRTDGLAVCLIYKKLGRTAVLPDRTADRCNLQSGEHCRVDRMAVAVCRGGPIAAGTATRPPMLGLAADALPRRCVCCSHFFLIFFEKKSC
jgi:hypothetical protein